MAKRRYYRSGIVRWYDDEWRSHREDGPASVHAHGSQYWYRHSWAHFAYGPSILNVDGTVRWYEDRQLLRERYPYG